MQIDCSPLFFAILCFYMGRTTGKTIDIQYREPEGNPTFIRIPDKAKPFFSFKYCTGNKVLKEGVAVQVIGYIFSLLEILWFLIAAIVPATESFSKHSEWGVLLLALLISMVIAPMGIRYERNVEKAYDCDWITTAQRALTLLPKRRCKVVKQIDNSIYAITLGLFGKKVHYAKSEFTVAVGTHLYALHSEESGYPFWLLKKH